MDRLANGIDPFEEAVSEIVTDERDRSVASYFLGGDAAPFINAYVANGWNILGYALNPNTSR